jgi:voltage-gated potassium channel
VFFETFDGSAQYQMLLDGIEGVTSVIFLIEYILRIWTADYLYPTYGKVTSRLRFVFSFYGLIDLLTFLPFFLPFAFNSGFVAFRMLRVIRVFRLFKINAQYDAFNVVIDVLREKRQQIFSSVCLILIMMMASSLCMYSIEHEAQPDVFQNAFSAIWWSVSTLLTVGYGDIYPITVLGKAMAIVIAFLGVGLVAIPTGIISAGFVEQYTKMKSLSEISEDSNLKFLMLYIEAEHPWVNTHIQDIVLPPELNIVAVIRNEKNIIIPKKNVVIHKEDRVVLGTTEFEDDIGIQVREVVVKKEHPWANKYIRDLTISKNMVVVAIYRNRKAIIPRGDTIIKRGDILTVCEKQI